MPTGNPFTTAQAPQTMAPTDYSVEQNQVLRQQQLADLLRKQALEQGGGTEMVSGWAVKKSPLEGLSKIAQAFGSRYLQNQADEKQTALATKLREQGASDMQGVMGAMQGTPEKITDFQPDTFDATDAQNMQQAGAMQNVQPAIAPDRRQAMALALQSQNPMVQGIGAKLLEGEMKGPESVFSKVDPKDYSAESVQKFAATKNYADLVPVRKKDFVNGQAVDAYTATPGTVIPKQQDSWTEPYQMGGAWVQKNPLTGEIKQAVARPPQTNVTVNGPKEVFKNEKDLRAEYTDASKTFVKVRDAYNTVVSTLDGPITAPATLAGATKFMKMLDPESVVRESELAMALKATGMMDRFTNLHNTVMKGQVLTPTQVKEIKRISEVLYNTAEKQHQGITNYYNGMAKEYGLKPERVTTDLRSVLKTEVPSLDDIEAEVLKRQAAKRGKK